MKLRIRALTQRAHLYLVAIFDHQIAEMQRLANISQNADDFIFIARADHVGFCKHPTLYVYNTHYTSLLNSDSLVVAIAYRIPDSSFTLRVGNACSLQNVNRSDVHIGRDHGEDDSALLA